MTEFATDFITKIKAGYPIIQINSAEETRVVEDIINIMQQNFNKNNDTDYFVAAYETCFGIVGNEVNTLATKQNFVDDPYGFLLSTTSLHNYPKNCVFILKDIHEYISDPGNPRVRRLLRDIAENNLLVNQDMRRFIVLLQPEWSLPTTLQHCCTVVEYNRPNEKELMFELETALNSPGIKDVMQPPDSKLQEEIVRALRGLTRTEALNCLYLCSVIHKGFPKECLKTIHKQKALTFKNDAVLEYIDEDSIPDMSDIKGYDNYLEFISECITCYSKEARQVGIPKPKGVLLLGIPGTGKSVAAMATASKMRLPLIKYNYGAVFGSLVGESEEKQRNAINRIKAQGPCVVLIDEADKAFGGVIGSSGDSGVGQRVFMQLLSWMANDNQEAFVIMTMNRIINPETGASIVPVESIRAGRLDATFYTDFPDLIDRTYIFEAHINKRNSVWKFEKEEWEKIVTSTANFVGAEIEQICIKAIRAAFTKRKSTSPTFDEVMVAIKSISPISVIDSNNVKSIAEFCRERATPVSKEKQFPKISLKRSINN